MGDFLFWEWICQASSPKVFTGAVIITGESNTRDKGYQIWQNKAILPSGNPSPRPVKGKVTGGSVGECVGWYPNAHVNEM